MDNTKMTFEYNLDDVAQLFQMRKSSVKRKLLTFGFVENADFIIKNEPVNSKRHGGHNRICIFITKKCYDQLILSLSLSKRVPVTPEVLQVDYIKRYIPDEIEILTFVCEVFSPSHQIKLQYPVLNYRIDLYFVTKKIAVECDENGHKDYDKTKEIKREIDIKNELGCIFVRFDPKCKNFKLATLISDIMKLCYQ